MSFETEKENDLDVSLDSEIKEPSLYKVVLYNDDYTDMDFVVAILIRVFHKSQIEAEQLMMKIHKTGVSTVGVYPYDIATTRVEITIRNARDNGFPLRCETEEVL